MPPFFKEPVSYDIDPNEKVHIEENGFIEFSQNTILGKVTSGKLNTVKIKYNGLCEIICNYILLYPNRIKSLVLEIENYH